MRVSSQKTGVQPRILANAATSNYQHSLFFEELAMTRWFDRWRRSTGKPGGQRRALPTLEPLEDRCVLSAVGYSQVNLASDLPGLAHVTVPSLVNPWGVSFSPTGPFWLADQGSGFSNLLNGRGQVIPLTVTVPATGASIGSPTGTVFNAGPGFTISANGAAAPSTFLFASEDGTISGWTEAVDFYHAVVAVDNSSSGAVYTGLALAVNDACQSVLYAADFSLGRIDVFDQDFQPIDIPGAFQDPNLPAGYAPYNIQNIGGRLYVAYARPNEDDVGEALKGTGLGFVDVFDTDGALLDRVAAQGTLNAPWGVTLAPADFGKFGGALLVGNNGDGRINAFAPTTGAFLGQLADDSGAPITIPDLWALTFGNGHAGGNADTLFFAAGVDYDAHGLFGAIQPPQLRGADTGGAKAFNPNAPGEAKNYPLPPANGPALQDPATAAHPVSVLLPLTETSLALAPTLSTASRDGTPSPAPANPLVVAASNTPGTPVVRFATYDSTVSSSNPDSPVALNSFLDLNAAPTAGPASILSANLDPVDRSAFFTSLQPFSDDAHSDRIEEISAPVRPKSTGARNASQASVRRNTWTKMLGLLCVIGVRVGWGYLVESGRRGDIKRKLGEPRA
jgi:uncharacterized protein (TIGR03118 family)